MEPSITFIQRPGLKHFAALRSNTVLNNEQLPGAMAQAYLSLCICLSDHYFCSLAISNPAGTNKS